jgi:hypothetical protein
MAHSPETKARALAMLLTGDAPEFVSQQTGVPYSSVKRWQGEAFDGLAAAIGPLDLQFFDFSQRNGHKKKRGRRATKAGHEESVL